MWDIALIKPRALQMRRLMSAAARNTYNLPEGFYRVDILVGDDGPVDLEMSQSGELVPTQQSSVPVRPLSLTRAQRLQVEHAAYIPLDYHDGFPTLPDGRPFWSRLKWEPDIAFALFQTYLSIGQEGTRTLFAVHRSAKEQGIQHPWSSSDQPHLGIQLCADMYCWQDRARAFDLFELVELRKSIQRRAIDTTDRHYKVAKKLFDSAFEHLEKIKTGEGEALTNREAIELLKVASSLERISVGLPAAGVPGKQEQDPTFSPNTPVDIMLGSELKRQGVGGVQRRSANLDQFLQDPALASQAQDIVLRLRGHKLQDSAGKGLPGVDAEPPDTDTANDTQEQESELSESEQHQLEREIAKDVASR